MRQGFVLTGDLHLTESAKHAARWGVFKFLETVAREQEVGAVLINGDIADAKDRHPAKMVNRLVDAIRDLAESVEVVISMGNHCYLDPKNPFFGFLEHVHPRVRYVRTPKALRIGGLRTLVLPHTRSPVQGGVLSFPSLRPSTGEYDAICLHQTLNGCQASNGQVLEGLQPSRFDPEHVGAAFVFSGDIHKPQRVGNVEYVGSPYQVAFGDEFVGRVLVVFQDQWIDVPNVSAPRKHTVSIDFQEVDGKWDEQVYAGDGCRVVLRLLANEVHEAALARKEILARLRSKGCVDASVRFDVIRVGSNRKRRPVFDEGSSWDNPTVFDRYCDAHNVEDDLRVIGRERLCS